jgi:hypothetical protein
MIPNFELPLLKMAAMFSIILTCVGLLTLSAGIATVPFESEIIVNTTLDIVKDKAASKVWIPSFDFGAIQQENDLLL